MRNLFRSLMLRLRQLNSSLFEIIIIFITIFVLSLFFQALHYANGFFIQCLGTVASNETITVNSCKPQPQFILQASIRTMHKHNAM